MQAGLSLRSFSLGGLVVIFTDLAPKGAGKAGERCVGLLGLTGD